MNLVFGWDGSSMGMVMCMFMKITPAKDRSMFMKMALATRTRMFMKMTTAARRRMFMNIVLTKAIEASKFMRLITSIFLGMAIAMDMAMMGSLSIFGKGKKGSSLNGRVKA